MIEFTIVTMSKDDDAVGLNMDEAVTRGKVALDHMQPAPSPLEPIQGVADASANMINNIKSVANSWDPLLQKVKAFTELVDTIAEVRDGTHELHGLDHDNVLASRFTHTPKWRGAFSLPHTRRVLCTL
jgi:hypothetical protein